MSGVTVLVSLVSSLISGVAVAFLSPRFAHLVWKKQRLREQRVAVAERFAKMGSDMHILGNLRPRPPQPGLRDERLPERVSVFLEQDALLALIFVLFERPETLASTRKLAAELRKESRDFHALYALRVDLLSRLFAEAFEIPTGTLTRRAQASG